MFFYQCNLSMHLLDCTIQSRFYKSFWANKWKTSDTSIISPPTLIVHWIVQKSSTRCLFMTLLYIVPKIPTRWLKLFCLFQAYTEAQIAEGKNTDSVALDVQYAPEPQKVGIYYYNKALLLIDYLFLWNQLQTAIRMIVRMNE